MADPEGDAEERTGTCTAPETFVELPDRKKAEEGKETAEQRDAVLIYGGERNFGRGMGGDEMEYELFEQDIARSGVDTDAGGVWGDVDEDLVVCELWDGE